MMPQSIEQINEELHAFLAFCKENNLTEKEIAQICEPLITPIRKLKLKRICWYILFCVLLLTALYYLTYIEAISWRILSLTRILLIKLLPWWNWKTLKYEKCLIPNPLRAQQQTNVPAFDCALCESITKIYVETDVDSQFLKEHYIDLHNPVIINNALNDWPIFHNSSINFLEDDMIYDSIPCKLSTNTHNGLTSVGKLYSKLKEFPEYFIHFQNCDFDVVKAFRLVAPKPSFVDAEISPIQYSWLLDSKNYNITNYKTVSLQESITFIGQVKGSNFYRLQPRQNCKNECPVLNIDLQRGEGLFITSLWDLEYKPTIFGENLAVILEMY